jgi:hypothetical protein
MSSLKNPFLETNHVPNNIEDLIKSVMVQTDYSREESLIRLKESNYDKINVIMKFIKGEDCNIYSSTQLSYSPPKLSPHQEVYRQIRYKMNDAMRGYTTKIDEHEEKNKAKMN